MPGRHAGAAPREGDGLAKHVRREAFGKERGITEPGRRLGRRPPRSGRDLAAAHPDLAADAGVSATLAPQAVVVQATIQEVVPCASVDVIGTGATVDPVLAAAWPSGVSRPSPPQITSAPPPPLMVSEPRSPTMTSAAAGSRDDVVDGRSHVRRNEPATGGDDHLVGARSAVLFPARSVPVTLTVNEPGWLVFAKP